MNNSLGLGLVAPGIVDNESFIADHKANEERLLNAGHISYPAFTVRAPERRFHDLIVKFDVAGYSWGSLWGSCLSSRSADRYAVATSSTALS